jgi:hypothetical protein
MPNIIITIHEDRLTIDGSLPEGYRLVVHNHSGNSDLYPYTQARSACRNDESDEESMRSTTGSNVTSMSKM